MNKTFCVDWRWCRFGWQTFFAFRFVRRVRHVHFFFHLTPQSMPTRAEKEKKYLIISAFVQKFGFVCGANLLGTVEPPTLCFFFSCFSAGIFEMRATRKRRQQKDTVPNRSSKSRSSAVHISLWRCAVKRDGGREKLLFTIFFTKWHTIQKATWKNEWTTSELLLLVYLVEWKQ